MRVFSAESLDRWRGELIGAGIHREVYRHKRSSNLVIKVGRAGTFANVLEWETWERLRWWSHGGQWLAPCKAISSCGKILLQDRTTPVPVSELPTHVPNWFTDTKWSNWGRLPTGEIVCHDYASTPSGRRAEPRG